MHTTYVCGHRNPDTDSIVSAMAYSRLMNALGDNDYVAARLGHLNDESAFLLQKFHFEPPLRFARRCGISISTTRRCSERVFR